MLDKLQHHWNVTSRRDFFTRAGSGLAAMALASLMDAEAQAAVVDPIAPRTPQVTPRAKSVIFCFMEGAPSHVDLFDSKPDLVKYSGQPVPPSFHPEKLVSAFGTTHNGLFPTRHTFKQYGQSGLWVSDWLPHISRHVDDVAVIRSCQADGVNHVGAVCQMNTGDILAGRPSMGAWVTYGLGSANQNLPNFVVMQDDKDIIGGVQNYGSGFLPATYQGTLFRKGDTPILNLEPPEGTTDAQELNDIAYLKSLNERYDRDKEDDTELDARTRSYELAYRMQSAAPEAVDLIKETQATKKLYGMDEPETVVYGTNCLLARRLVERGVRFVEVYSGSGSRWDAHNNLESNHTENCKSSDKPVAGLLADLKSRGMLNDTLVVWGGEFGRTPFVQGKPDDRAGRDHNPWGFTMWMAGGGVKGGQPIGTTDEIGLRAVDESHHVHDLHASILSPRARPSADHLPAQLPRRASDRHRRRPHHKALGVRYLTRCLVVAALAAIGALAQTLPDGPGKQIFEDTCSLCHSPTAVISMHKTKAEWKSKVTEMLQEQDVSDSDRTAIIDYLARSFPATLNVNKATEKDIEALLGAKDASAIVQYRESKGNFKTIDDLKKVPGIDTAKLEAIKQQLDFQER